MRYRLDVFYLTGLDRRSTPQWVPASDGRAYHATPAAAERQAAAMCGPTRIVEEPGGAAPAPSP